MQQHTASLTITVLDPNSPEPRIILVQQTDGALTVEYTGADSADDWVGVYPRGGVIGQGGGSGYLLDGSGQPLIALTSSNGGYDGQLLSSTRVQLNITSEPPGDYELRFIGGGYLIWDLVTFSIRDPIVA